MYFEAIRQDTFSEHLDIKQLPESILPLRGVRCAKYWCLCVHQVGIAFPSIRFAPKGVPLYTNKLSHKSVGKIHKIMT
jgi:hypothetical protein